MIHFRMLPLVVVLALFCGSSTCNAFSSSSSNSNNNNNNNITPIKPVRVSISSKEYANAMSTIDAASRSGTPADDLYDAVRVIDKNARYVYPDEASKEELWERAYGSWKLVLATGGGRFTTFKPVPIFAFAMLDETNFGNGVGLNENAILLSLLGPHELVTKRRQMVINIDDVFLASRKVTGMVPSFVGDGMGLGKRPADYEVSGSRPPAFVFIAASETSLVARGGSGGIAIWTRLEKDIRPAAYNL
mmetsp:Transcript_27823/g.75695  ORF Transcript_27823/g.75695 Transcript_27823/m.75695 type:complete len:247 (-) Transcript_27823:123-863(-)